MVGEVGSHKGHGGKILQGLCSLGYGYVRKGTICLAELTKLSSMVWKFCRNLYPQSGICTGVYPHPGKGKKFVQNLHNCRVRVLPRRIPRVYIKLCPTKHHLGILRS